MSMSIPLWVELRVRRMTVAGFTSYVVAEELGIERSVVRSLLKRSPSRRFTRCATCGGRVLKPCRLCLVRAEIALRKPLSPSVVAAGTPLAVVAAIELAR
jgi:hypothetical protein